MAEKKEQKSIKNPHDKFFKETLGMRKNARSFLENYLPVQIRELIEIDSLEIEKDSFVTQELQDYYSDLLYKVKFGSYDGYIYLLFEHKSYSEKWICLQLLEYILQIWKVKKGDGEQLPIIVPLVLYHGKTTWKIGVKLSDLLQYKEPRLMNYVPDFEYLLYDLTKYEDQDIQGIAKLKVALYLMKYIWSADIVARLEKILSLLQGLPQSEMEFLVTITIYVLYTTEIPISKLVEIVEKNVSQRGGEMIMTTAEKLIEEGIRKGEEIGIRKGEEIGIRKGIRKGEEIGIRKGKLEGIEALLEVKFGANGLSLIDDIRKFSDMEKLSQIQQLIKKAKTLKELRNNLKNL